MAGSSSPSPSASAYAPPPRLTPLTLSTRLCRTWLTTGSTVPRSSTYCRHRFDPRPGTADAGRVRRRIVRTRGGKMDENVRRARDLMARSRKEHFAVGAFNVDNQETLVAIARAAQVKNSPVLVEVSQSEVDAIGLVNHGHMADNY